MNQDLNKSEWIIKGMASWFGGMSNWFSGPDTKPIQYEDSSMGAKQAQKSITADGLNTNFTKNGRMESPRLANGVSGRRDGRMLRADAHPADSLNTKEEEEEESKKLDMLLGMVGNMKSIAEDTGVELENQNKMLHRIDHKLDHTRARIEKNTRNAKKLMD